jgi:hypothetical protein
VLLPRKLLVLRLALAGAGGAQVRGRGRDLLRGMRKQFRSTAW